jgi:hypothetical protein
MRDTFTAKVHDAVRPPRSVAVQRTSLDPSGNGWPDAGVHATDTGASPPCAAGVSNVTVAPAPVVVAETPAGHVSVGPAGAGVTGVVGLVGEDEPPQPAVKASRASTPAHAVVHFTCGPLVNVPGMSARRS